MGCLFLLVVTLLIQSIASQLFDEIQGEIERTAFVNVINGTNEFERLFEKYVLNTDEHYWKIDEEAESEYDFVIVGSGSAGSVIANRLSETRSWRILLLEAGETEDSLVAIPLTAGAFQGTTFDWQYKIEKQPNACLGFKQRRMPWPRGKALGGSSVLNLMMYVRGNKWDFEKWAGLGNKGWSFDEVLPFFKKSEKARRLEDIEESYHGKYGYLGIENGYRGLLGKTLLEAGEELGLPQIDYNAPTESFGFGRLQSTLWNGRRNSAARAFLHPIKDRTNLDILIGAFVTKILINPQTKEAYGVTYEKNKKSYMVRARKEVILSAGVINSPQLLMLSGIGPKDHLAELGIKTIENLAVGRNLQDHLVFYGTVYTINYDFDETLLRLSSSVPSYILFGDGPLTTPGGVEGIGFIKTPESDVEVDQPDIELMFVRTSLAADYGNVGKTVFHLTEQVYDSFFKDLEKTYHWSICPILLHPKSKGYLKLQSTDPHVHPLLYPMYFTDPQNKDIKTMIAGIRFIQKLGNTTAFRDQGARQHAQHVFGCEKLTFDTDQYWECALRVMGNTLYHQLGTNKMGPRKDKTAVVSNQLKVHGIQKLRVCDCSVMPVQVSGHTNAIAMAIGEKCADFIKRTWGVPY